MDSTAIDFDFLIETSWEVCNKVGGIYTVLSTKAKTLQNNYKDKVAFIGPDVWTVENPCPVFVESKTLLKAWKQSFINANGVTVRVGRWDIPGKPIAILVGFNGMYAANNELYARMWQLYGVDSLHAYGDYDEACAFSHAAGVVIDSLAKFFGVDQGKRIIAHFDEWTTGMGLLYVKDVAPNVATIFTTHATCIGRSICGNGKPLYDYLNGYNGDQMAFELNMQSKHSLEKTAAWQADCFTTVSEVTAKECEQLLGRRPDVVTPNGFERNFVPSKAKYSEARSTARQSMLNVAAKLTGVQFPDDTFIVATSGRCEYRNKGIDLFLDSVARLRDFNPQKKVLAFVMVPAWVKAARTDLCENLKNNENKRLDNPVISHDLYNPFEDAILARIHQIGFANDDNSQVSVIFVPCYLNGCDGVFDKKYYELIPGLDATVFPSYYEPWGYTPLESIAFGVPTITTSLSGFGQWIISSFDNSFDKCGVKVISRGDFDFDAVKEAIALQINSLIDCSTAEMEKIRKSATNTASKADWELFIAYYHEAFEIALRNANNRIQLF